MLRKYVPPRSVGNSLQLLIIHKPDINLQLASLRGQCDKDQGHLHRMIVNYSVYMGARDYH